MTTKVSLRQKKISKGRESLEVEKRARNLFKEN